MDFPAFEHARWLAEAWRHGAPAHNLGASGLLPDDPLDGLPAGAEAQDVGHLDLNAGTDLRDATAGHLGLGAGQVRITGGTSAANTAVIAASVSPGDHVVCERPTYMPLPQLAQGLGAKITWVDTLDGVEPDAFEDACTDRTRLILVTSPNNPTGHAADEATLRALGDVASAHGAHVLADQVYRELTDHPLGAAVHDAVVSTGGLNKCWGAPGLRIGWAAGAPEAMARVEEAHRILALAPPSFGTRMALALLAQAYRRRALLDARLAQTHAIYEAWCDDTGIGPQHGALVAFPAMEGDSMALARSLLDAGILTVPGDLFGRPGHLRIGLGIPPDALEAGLEALAQHLARPAAQRF